MNTLLLSTPSEEEPSGWDLTVDSRGNIALATGHYAIAQDVASAVRLFQGELWYDTTQGLPYFEEVLGKRPSIEFMKAMFVEAGLAVPAVVSIKCFLTGPGRPRVVGGQMQITDNTGKLSVVEATTVLQPGVAPWYVNASLGGPTYLPYPPANPFTLDDSVLDSGNVLI